MSYRNVELLVLDLWQEFFNNIETWVYNPGYNQYATFKRLLSLVIILFEYFLGQLN